MRVVSALVLVPLHDVDHPVLPCRRVPPLRNVREAHHLGEFLVYSPATGGFVRDLVEHVREIMHGIDNPSYVRLLKALNPRVEGKHLIVDDRSDVDAVDVVEVMEWMTLDAVWGWTEMQRPALEQHHPDVDAGLTGGDDAFAQAIKEC